MLRPRSRRKDPSGRSGVIATLPERGWGADSKGVEVDSGIYLSATGAIAAEARLDVIANNLANIETPGFKKSFTLQRGRT